MNYSLEFAFNGIHSSTFDVYKVTLESGMQEENYFLANKSVNGFRLKNDYHSHKTSATKEPLVIPLVLWLNGDIDFEKEQRIKEWLETDEYCKLQFDDQLFHYNAMLQGQPRFVHDSRGDGYVEFEFITDSPYRFSDVITLSNFDKPLGDSDGKVLSLINNGNLITYPLVEITVPSDVSTIKINNSTTKQNFILNYDDIVALPSQEAIDKANDVNAPDPTQLNNETQLKDSYKNLTVNIYNEYEELDSEGNWTDLYERHNGVFIGLQKGRNELQLTGKFYYKITYQNVYL